MNRDRSPSKSVAPLAMERLRILLDAYGGRPEHWPEAERDAALALLASSEEARSLRVAALDLDMALDSLETEIVDSEFLDLVQSTIPAPPVPPSRRRVPPRYFFAAIPLAAAAALALWISLPDRAPRPLQFAVEDLGQYVTPTDTLLDSPGFDVSDTLPSLGCSESGFGCVDDSRPDLRESQSHQPWRVFA